MKKLSHILILLTFMTLLGCNNLEKSRAYFDQGMECMMVKGKFAEAETAFDNATKYDKKNPELYYYLACSRFNQGKFKEAVSAFEKAIELKPDYADAYFSLGRTYDRMYDNDMSCYYYRLAEKYGRPNMVDLLKYCP